MFKVAAVHAASYLRSLYPCEGMRRRVKTCQTVCTQVETTGAVSGKEENIETMCRGIKTIDQAPCYNRISH